MSSSEFTDPELPDPFSSESSLHRSQDAPEGSEASDPSQALREGLPRGFRMRHDAHYVDQLDSTAAPVVLRMLPLGGIDARACDDGPAIEALARSIRRIGIVEPLVVRRSAGRYQVIAGAKRLSAARLAQLDKVPCVVRDDLAEDALGPAAAPPPLPAHGIDDRPRGPFSSTARERALDEAIGGMNAARTSVELTLPRSDRLRSRTAADLVRAELLGARQALTAMRILSAPPMVRRSGVNPHQLLDATVAELAPVLRLSGAQVTVTAAADLPPVVPMMRPLVAFALEACISTALTLAGEAAQPPLALSIGSDKESSLLSFATRVDGGWLPAETAKRLTDTEWTGHPAGTTTAMIAAAAEAVAKLHDGSIDVATDYDGFGITLTIRA